MASRSDPVDNSSKLETIQPLIAKQPDLDLASPPAGPASGSETTVCGICLEEFGLESLHVLHKCRCSFCRDCLSKYFQFMVDNGHLRIYCPSFRCMHNNEIESDEIAALISPAHQEKYAVLRNNRVMNEYLENSGKVRCPFCDQIFDVNVQQSGDDSASDVASKAVKCPSCLEMFCATCHIRMASGEGHNCDELATAVLNAYDIKKCPNCSYLIQREGGCAQISCRNCQHIFCWHCLKGLETDFLLFHYDSGPCKGKLGHSRISIFFNRVQTISICLGISILMILASPVILMTLPCLLTSKCRMCCRHKRQEAQV